MKTNPNGTGTTKDSQLEQELNELRRQHEQLRDQRVRTEQDMTHLSNELARLKEQAREEYGTDDPEELQALLEKKREENERVVSEYREHIQQVQQDLAAVENRVEGDEQ